MKKIKFSHYYIKHTIERIDEFKTQLLEVIKVKSEDLHQRFIEYDTQYMDKEGINFYKLPKGYVLILFLHTYDYGERCDPFLWTTIRRWTPQKEKYYKNLRGEEVEIEINRD